MKNRSLSIRSNLFSIRGKISRCSRTRLNIVNSDFQHHNIIIIFPHLHGSNDLLWTTSRYFCLIGVNSKITIKVFYCVKSVRVWSFSGKYFAVLGLNTDQKNSEYKHFSCSVYDLFLEAYFFSRIKATIIQCRLLFHRSVLWKCFRNILWSGIFLSKIIDIYVMIYKRRTPPMKFSLNFFQYFYSSYLCHSSKRLHID